MKKVCIRNSSRLGTASIIIGVLLILVYQPLGHTGEDSAPPTDLLRYVCEVRSDRLAELHDSLLKTLIYREMLEDYDLIINATVAESIISLLRPESFLAIMDSVIPEAKAARAALYCNYGGWPSLIGKKSKKCLKPWNPAVKRNSFIKNLGDVYSGSKYRCGQKNLFRCNPTIFGFGTDRKTKNGICVEIPEEHPQQVMMACMKAHAPNIDKHLKKLRKTPKMLAKYLGIAAETIRYCNKEEDDNPYCPEFIETVRSVANSSLCCDKDKELLPYLPVIQSPDNFKALDDITKGLLTKYSKELRKIAREQAKKIAREQAKKSSYKERIKKYANSSQVAKMIRKLKSNAKRCIGKGSCRRRKASTTSIGKCLRYVKHGLMAGGFVGHYPSGTAAKYFGNQLKKMNFVNLRTLPGYKKLKPKDAPKGAVIVYKGGKYGHIEVKMSHGKKSKYGSDFIAPIPISRTRLPRYVKGIYVKI